MRKGWVCGFMWAVLYAGFTVTLLLASAYLYVGWATTSCGYLLMAFFYALLIAGLGGVKDE